MQRRHFLQAGAALAGLGAQSALHALPSVDTFLQRAAQDRRVRAFAGIEHELAAGPLRTTGRWPAGLAGRFYRNGPARLQRGGERVGHWFEGDGMVQQFRIAAGRITHQGRFVQTSKLVAEERAGRLLYPMFGGEAPRAPVTGPDSVNVANTNAIEVGGRVLALWEGGSAYALDPESLATQGPVVWQPGWEGLPFSAHPKLDPQGRLWNFGTMGDKLALYQIGADGRLEKAQLGTLPVRSVMAHDAAVTERYFVLPLPPLRYEAGDKGLTFRWHGDEPLRVLVVDKQDVNRQVIFELPPEMVFHVAHAWERPDGTLVLGYMGSPDGGFLQEAQHLMAGQLRPGAPACTVQVELDLKTRRWRRHAFDDQAEFPRIHPQRIGQPCRWLLSVASWGAARPVFAHGLQWRDLQSGRVHRYDFGPHYVVEEHVVVPKQGARREDDAWALGTSYDLRRGTTQLNLFDLRAIESGPIAQAFLPYALPLGFHGNFTPG